MLQLYNSLTRQKEALTPLEKDHVRMYVCGPTVYDRPHLGNARSVVIYDVLFRLLSHLYPKVTYVRNVTDVDDKINAAAKQNSETINSLTQRVEGWFKDDMAALNVLNPTREPHATTHIAEMIAMIETLIHKNHAYVAQGHVLFSVKSYSEYGALSGRKLEDLIAGARVEVEDYKRDAGDFVLWKPANPHDDPSAVFESPWGAGRPGWHIECSAMAGKYLGDTFDIHGGGTDLKFPHHENEIAQSRCALDGAEFARMWVHNGFLTVEGEKMSKSLGNFTTVKDVLDKGISGEVIRLALLNAHYRSPLDWNEKLIEDAKKTLDKFYKLKENAQAGDIPSEVIDALSDDLNLSKALAALHGMSDASQQIAAMQFLGFLQQDAGDWFAAQKNTGQEMDNTEVQSRIDARIEAKKNKDYAKADKLRDELVAAGIIIEDKPGDITEWRRR